VKCYLFVFFIPSYPLLYLERGSHKGMLLEVVIKQITYLGRHILGDGTKTIQGGNTRLSFSVKLSNINKCAIPQINSENTCFGCMNFLLAIK
jgi:hypothetical protein